MGRRSTATNAEAEESLDEPKTGKDQSKAVEAAQETVLKHSESYEKKRDRDKVNGKQLAIRTSTPDRSVASTPVSPPTWTIEDSEELYRINGWGEPYFRLMQQGMLRCLPKAIAVAP